MSCASGILNHEYVYIGRLSVSDFNMIAKVNVPKTTLFIVVLLVVILLAYKIFERQLETGKEFRRNISSTSSSYKLKYAHGKGSNGVELSRSIFNKDRNLPPTDNAVQKPTKKTTTKPTKPVIKKFNLLWRKNGNVFYREIVPIGKPKLDILLMHGKMFDSTTWVTLKTMDILASSGYHVIAMDLPGAGNTHFNLTDKTDKNLAKFLGKFIKKAGLDSPVILSPSYSGSYALPYIVGNVHKVSGFVPIAAVASDRFAIKNFKHFKALKAPTLIIRGSKDITLGKTSMDTLHQAIPHSETVIIEGAGHACYIDKPNEFHKTLLKFLNGILKMKRLK